MAASLNGKTVNGRRGRYRPLSEINVTPMVDVMLVLLVIFMVTAPLMTSGIDVDLPKTDAKPLNQDSDPITVSIDAKGEIYLRNAVVTLPDLVERLRAMAENNPERRIFVRGDNAVNYGLVVQVMGTITQGGFTKVALLAEQPSPVPAGGQPAATAPGKTPAPAPAPAGPAPNRSGAVVPAPGPHPSGRG
jgi:biopolymer transport protein TolR